MNTRASQASKRNPVGWPGSRAVVDAADAKTGDRDWASPLRGRLIAFVVAVALPTICAALYLQFFAPVEYLAETRFAVRGASEGLPGSDRIGGSLGQLIALNDSQEAHIVAAYINSLAIVADVGKADDLGVLFGAKAVDGDRPITAEAAPERALAFWRRHVDADVDVISGVTTLRVRAFAPNEAIALSNSILKASESMADGLSARVKASAIAARGAEVERALAAAQDAQSAVSRFRDERGMLDPSDTAARTERILERLQAERRQMETESSVASETAGASSPMVENLKRQLAALDREADQLRSLLTSDGGSDVKSLSGAMQAFDRLEFDREFADQRLLDARAELQRAKAQAARRRVYLEAFDPPALTPTPPGWRRLLQMAAGAGVVASVAILAFASFREFGSV